MIINEISFDTVYAASHMVCVQISFFTNPVYSQGGGGGGVGEVYSRKRHATNTLASDPSL